MSTPCSLDSAIAQYLSHKRSLGHAYRGEAGVLARLRRGVRQQRRRDLDPTGFDHWLRGLRDLHPNTRRRWHQIVRNFCLYRRRDEPHCFVPTDNYANRQPYITPVIVEPAQVAQMLTLATSLATSPNSPLRGAVTRMAVILLYTAGLRFGELLRLTLDDILEDGALLRIRESKFHKSRWVPLSSSASRELRDFLLIGHHPEHMAALQSVLVVPFKRGAQRRPVDYLEPGEVESLLGNIERLSASGQRDYALFALMLNTGARVHEVLNLKACDVRLESPHQVRFVGKGNKVRLCPIWPRTAKVLALLMASNRRAPDDDPVSARIFKNRRGEPLTRFGVRYLLRKYLPKRLGGGSGTGKRIHPHMLCHTTAIYLLKAGVDLATISQWLGHASLNTTMRYARADPDLKRQAQSQVFPEVLGAPTAGRLLIDGSEFTRWLRRI